MTKRVTIPDGALAIIVPAHQAEEFYNLCRLIRAQGAKAIKDHPASHSICGDFMLAYIEAKDRA